MAAAFHTHLFALVGGAFEVGRDGAKHEAWVCREMSPAGHAGWPGPSHSNVMVPGSLRGAAG